MDIPFPKGRNYNVKELLSHACERKLISQQELDNITEVVEGR